MFGGRKPLGLKDVTLDAVNVAVRRSRGSFPNSYFLEELQRAGDGHKQLGTEVAVAVADRVLDLATNLARVLTTGEHPAAGAHAALELAAIAARIVEEGPLLGVAVVPQ